MTMAYQAPSQYQIQNTRDVKTHNGIKVMVYGLAGSGKTRLLATAPKPIIVSAEQGLLSLSNQDVPFIQIKQGPNEKPALEQLKEIRMQIYNDKRFWTACLDSASEIAEVCLRDMMARNKDPRKAYGDMAQEVLAEVRMWRDFPQRHIVFIMKQGRIKDEQTGGILNGPLMPGNQLDQHMPYMFDELFQLVTMGGNSGLRTRRDNLNEAKDRSGKLDEWERPDLTYIFNKIAA
jgi:hypothetical protein